MRIPKGKTQVIDEAPTSRFLLVVDAMDGEIKIEKEGGALISIALDENGRVCARLCFSDGTSAELYGEEAYHKEVILTAGYARVGLYVGGLLQDEEFFYAPIDYLGAVIYPGSYMHFEAGYEYHSMPETAITPDAVGEVEGYRPIGREMTVRAALPYALSDRLHLFYLDCRRDGKVKHGVGAYRLDALYSTDGEHYGKAPMALPIDSIEEERMTDAALTVVDGRYYLYYLVDYRAGRALSCAVSEDGFSYAKTGLDVEIPTARAQNMRAVSVYEADGAVYLVYATAEGVFRAKSRDLLYFDAPTCLLPIAGVTGLHAAGDGARTYLFVDTAEGTRLYTVKGQEMTVASCLPIGTRGAFYRGAWQLFSVGEQGEMRREVVSAL